MLGEARDVVECFSLFLECSSRFLFQVLYNRTEHNQGFFACFMMKNPLNPNALLSNFLSRLLKDGVQALALCFIRVMISRRSDKLFLKTALPVEMRQSDQKNLYQGCLQALALIR